MIHVYPHHPQVLPAITHESCWRIQVRWWMLVCNILNPMCGPLLFINILHRQDCFIDSQCWTFIGLDGICWQISNAFAITTTDIVKHDVLRKHWPYCTFPRCACACFYCNRVHQACTMLMEMTYLNLLCFYARVTHSCLHRWIMFDMQTGLMCYGS